MRIKLIVTVQLLHIMVTAQNLVVNPDFESHEVPKSFGAWMYQGDMFSGYSVEGWSQPTSGSSDYFFRADVKTPMNLDPYAGPHEPASGNAFAGMINWLPGREYREYLTGQLNKPLEKGKTYSFKMKVCTGAYGQYLVNQMGVYFNKERYKDNTHQFTIKASPQVILNVQGMVKEPEKWIEVENTFIAQGGEQYFTIGNFLNDTFTVHSQRQGGYYLCPFAYYYIDDMCVIPSNGVTNTIVSNPVFSSQFQPGKTFIARGINFDLDRATLRPESYLQLHAIAAELKQKENLKVEIRGYTDTTGNEAHNLQLSSARAKAVADYLVSTGIDRNRIRYGGYGSTEPVSTTDVTLNRRVEFRFE